MKRYLAATTVALAYVVSGGLGLDPAVATMRPEASAQESDDAGFMLAQDKKENSEPLVLSVDDAPNPDDHNSQEENQVEELPQDVVQKADGDDAAALDSAVPVETINEEEMEALSRQPLFREFANIIDETAPLPGDVDVENLGVPGAQLVVPATPQHGTFDATPQTSPGELAPDLERLLSETLAIAEVDLEQYQLAPSQKRALESLDSEIGRLWPLWIDAEINRNVVGRRERDWRQSDYTRFSTTPGKTLEEPGDDFAFALDEPFWFQVVDLLSGESFYTKAGDFEQVDATGSMALLREERRYALVIEEGRVAPTGRAMRIKVLKDGTIQGVDASGRLVTDVNLGQIPLFMFQNPARMDSRDGVFFTPTPYSGPPQRASLNIGTTIGVNQHSLTLSNGRPEELLARIRVLCKSKARLFELVAHTTIPPKSQTSSVVPNAAHGIDAVVASANEPETIATPAPELVAAPERHDESDALVVPSDSEMEFVLPDE